MGGRPSSCGLLPVAGPDQAGSARPRPSTAFNRRSARTIEQHTLASRSRGDGGSLGVEEKGAVWSLPTARHGWPSRRPLSLVAALPEVSITVPARPFDPALDPRAVSGTGSGRSDPWRSIRRGRAPRGCGPGFVSQGAGGATPWRGIPITRTSFASRSARSGGGAGPCAGRGRAAANYPPADRDGRLGTAAGANRSRC